MNWLEGAVMTTQDTDSNYDTDSDSDDTDSGSDHTDSDSDDTDSDSDHTDSDSGDTDSSHSTKTILLEQLDKLLGQFYSPRNRKDYFDENGKGRFRQFCEEELHDDDDIKEQLKEDMEDSELADEDFLEYFMKYTPYYSSTETYDEGRSQQEQWWYIIQYLYQHRQLPPHSVPFISWRDISDAVKHQMYSAIGTKMDEVIEDIEESESVKLYDLSAKAVDNFVNLLQQKKRMSNIEVAFFRDIVERAKQYQMGQSLVFITSSAVYCVFNKRQ